MTLQILLPIAQPARLPHSDLDPTPLPSAELGLEKSVQALLLPFLPEPQRFAGLQVAHHYPLPIPLSPFFTKTDANDARTIPAATFITVDSAAFDGDPLVDATCDGKKSDDVPPLDSRSRAEPVD
jgi:hypothetical protein